MLSTGVYLSGNAGIEVGACYAIARDGDQLRVFGPVDAGQLTVRHEGPVRDFDVTAMDDRLIISGRAGRSTLAIVFRTIGGMRAADLESALRQAGRRHGHVTPSQPPSKPRSPRSPSPEIIGGMFAVVVVAILASTAIGAVPPPAGTPVGESPAPSGVIASGESGAPAPTPVVDPAVVDLLANSTIGSAAAGDALQGRTGRV